MQQQSYNIATINLCNISNEKKISALRSFIRSAELDIIFLQEVHDKELMIPGFTITFNVDFNNRGTAIAVRDQFQVGIIEKSLDSRIISLRINTVTFINIYAPSGAQARTSREDFFNTSVAHYLHHATDHIVLGGDFNAIVKIKDATGSSNISPMCKRLMEASHLTDTWEILNGNRVEFSFIRSNTASRLDRILISKEMISQIRSAHFCVNSFSDHKAYVVRMVLPNLGASAGRGIWRLQPHILDDPEVLDELSRKWRYWIRSRSSYRSWIEWWLQFAKPKVISFLKWQTSKIHRNFRETLELYRHILQTAYDNYLGHPEQRVTINRIKAQMLNHQRNFSTNFRRINETFLSGEPTTLFHVGQLYGKRAKTSITVLEKEDGNEITETSQINSELRSYFEQLYAAANVEQSDYFQPTKAIPEQNSVNDRIMQPITGEEILHAIKASCSKKSPGIDGLPKEFYQKSWQIISTEFTNVINDALNGNGPQKFHDGVIVLVKKKGSDRSVKGYRPISLLNCDYKLLAKILKQRMQNLLPLVLSAHQKCSNGKRNIYEATSRIFDKICQLKHHRENSLLVSFDLDHAFDRVDHNFLKATLMRMNFNPQLVNLLVTIWDRSFSRLLINGRLSQEFKIGQSVRQGDPLSMHLFVIYLQPLLDALSRRLPNTVINAYADDISMFLGSEADLSQVVNIFIEFGLLSGAILNKRKTVAVMIGDINLTSETEWLNIENTINILGILFGNDVKQARKLNWQSVIRGLHTRLWVHYPRKLNLIQKQILINTYITSKIWYMASNVGITIGFASKIKKELGKFLWYGQVLQRVAYANMILPKNRGGLNLHCPEIKSKSLLVNGLMTLYEQLPFLRSLIEDPNTNIPSMYSHIRMLLAELPLLPELLRNTPSSQTIYDHFLSTLPDPGFAAETQRDWKKVFKNLHSKFLSSAQRSCWFLVMHKKFKHRELLFRRNIIDDPFCEICPGEPETFIHKLFRCQRVREVWRFQRRQLLLQDRHLARLEPEDFVYPNFRHLTRTQNKYI